MLTLKRFNHDRTKNPEHVYFPTEWDANLDVTYHLKAVIVHDGDSNFSGHYRSYCCNSIGIWYAFDDAMQPTPICVDQVRECQAYCLLYCLA